MIPSFLQPERVPFVSVEVVGRGIYDAAGRFLAESPDALPVRPDGPWDGNVPVVAAVPVKTICAWCPTWNREDPANAGASHGICPTCLARLEQDLR
jgi:hypothetical protein